MIIKIAYIGVLVVHLLGMCFDEDYREGAVSFAINVVVYVVLIAQFLGQTM